MLNLRLGKNYLGLNQKSNFLVIFFLFFYISIPILFLLNNMVHNFQIFSKMGIYIMLDNCVRNYYVKLYYLSPIINPFLHLKIILDFLFSFLVFYVKKHNHYVFFIFYIDDDIVQMLNFQLTNLFFFFFQYIFQLFLIYKVSCQIYYINQIKKISFFFFHLPIVFILLNNFFI